MMKSSNSNKSNSLKAALLIFGFVVSGLIVSESLDRNQNLLVKGDSYDSLTTSIKNHKSMIVNTYLIGVSIYKEALD